jgi:hypothetical protein
MPHVVYYAELFCVEDFNAKALVLLFIKNQQRGGSNFFFYLIILIKTCLNNLS